MKNALALSAAALVFVACSPSLSVDAYRPGELSPGTAEQLLLADGFGRLSAREIGADAMRRAVDADGWLRFSDRTRDLAFDVSGGQVELRAEDALPPNALVVRVDAIEFFIHETLEAQQARDEAGESIEVMVPVLEAVTLFQISVATGEGVLLADRLEFEARSRTELDSGLRDEELLAEATDAAFAAFVAELTPDEVKQRIPLDDSDQRLKSALDLAMDGQLAAAEDNLEKFLEENPNSAVAHYNLGAVRDAQRRHEAALENYDDAIALTTSSTYLETRADCRERLSWQQELGR